MTTMLLLAPMEGLLDATLRDALTRVGGIDRCVSEFIRVTGMLLPDRVFTRIVPELLNGGRTRAGVPVRPQLLGSDAVCLAENAAKIAELMLAPGFVPKPPPEGAPPCLGRPGTAAAGAPGIDLNFGCPAKVVNRHGGGAMLLQDPELVGRIVGTVRRAVPAHVPVSAKMRLGYHDDLRAEECAQAIADAGADELVVHARTKAHGYKPPAYWDRIAAIRNVVKLPVIANGEIWTLQDAQRCRAASGCNALMLGRGMVADPGLALAIRGEPRGMTWPALLPLMAEFWQLVSGRVEPRHRAGRLKQWLNYLRRRYREAQAAYDELRTINDPRVIGEWLERYLPAMPSSSTSNCSVAFGGITPPAPRSP